MLSQAVCPVTTENRFSVLSEVTDNDAICKSNIVFPTRKQLSAGRAKGRKCGPPDNKVTGQNSHISENIPIVRNTSAIIVPAGSELIYFGHIQRNVTQTAVLEPIENQTDGILIASCLVDLKDTRDVPIKMLNLTTHPITIQKNTALARLYQANYKVETPNQKVLTVNPLKYPRETDPIVSELHLEHLTEDLRKRP